MSDSSLTAPRRISLAGHVGTVKYVGGVDNTSGTWLGIEWDDPQRGKHHGSKDGKQYFACRFPHSGSFIRPSANISYGQSFLEALTSKYVETPHGPGSQETVVLGSSNGAITVEAVHLDKIRGKLADLGRLREVSLDGQDVARCDPQGTIHATCPSIRGLDLSASLLPGWDDVALITREMPNLWRLVLKSVFESPASHSHKCKVNGSYALCSRNRLKSGTHIAVMETGFLNLVELKLNGTMMIWEEIQRATAFMPKLEVLEIGHNELTELRDDSDGHCLPRNSRLRVINLDGNRCWDWIDLWRTLKKYTCLERLILTSNWFKTIPFRGDREQGLEGIKYISLSHNKIEAWRDVDALSSWYPDIETLTLSGNSLTSREPAGHWRPFTIARIPTLLGLDGAVISAKERVDSEIFYLSYVMRETGSEDERIQAHPQWLRLCKKHGRPDETVHSSGFKDKLGERLITLNLYRQGEKGEPTLLRVLPTMKLRTVRQKICKIFNIKGKTVSLWLEQIDGERVELESDHENLAWLGLGNGDNLTFQVNT